LSVKQDFSVFSLRGPLHLDLTLNIPFSAAKTDVKGRVEFQNAAILFSLPWLDITQLQGEFSFNNKIFSSKEIHGVFLEEPMTMQIASPSQKSNNLLISVNGKLSIAALKKHFSPEFLNDFSGISDFNTNILVQGFGKSSQIASTISSDLEGVSITHIPAPFSKLPEEQKPLKVVVAYQGGASVKVQADYANLFSTALKLKAPHFALENGEIHIGQGVANFQELPNLLITADLASVDWSEWKRYWDSHASQSGGDFLKTIREIQIRMAQLKAFNNLWPNVYLQVTPGHKSTSIRVESPLATGELDIPFDADQPLWINFENLSWPENKGGENNTLDPSTIPSIHARIQRFQYGKKSLGDVQFISTRYQEGMTINKLTSHLPNADLFLNGYWHKFGAKQSSLLQGYLSTVDLGSLLNQWNYPRTLEGGKGTIQVRFSWPSSLFNFSPDTLNGRLKINLKKGSILKISESAQEHLSLARLVNILNISTLPKLLTLDFKGLKGDGLPFSVMEGDFVFSNGSAQTDNFYMNGSVAQIWVQGKMDFANQRYDLTLRIAPYVTASVPVIAGVAGGPLIGGAAWVAEKLVGGTIGKVIGKTYKVTGTWQKPIITKIGRTQ
jgi:uncharacterized protein YhdP